MSLVERAKDKVLPYVQIADITLVARHAITTGFPSEPIAIRPFCTLVALAVIFGAWLSLRQARRRKLAPTAMIDLLYWVSIGGFLGGHVFDVLFYHPALAVQQPWLLLDIASGQSSFGGFVGATLGALLWRLVRRRPLGPYAEAVASSFPAAWVVGRLGCAVAHDHPGIRSQLWFAVAYPSGGRLDLGLLEALAVVPLALAALWLRQAERPQGYFIALMCIYYAPVRFVMDFLRARDLASSDARYVGLTPAQWAAFLLIGLGLYFSTVARKSAARRASGARAAAASAPSHAGRRPLPSWEK
ncbi:MAG TPA: prolipoprotein diacylglyceryl transferase family protein [Polyangiaceae bacterium]